MLSVKTTTISTADLSVETVKDGILNTSTSTSSDLSPTYSPTDISSSSSSSSSSFHSASPTNSNRPSTPIKSRPSTPSTPPSSNICSTTTKKIATPKIINNTTNTKKIPYYQSNQDNFLQLIEPFPVSPPTYDTLPPGGCPKFPIFNTNHFPHHDILPSYSPSIYKIGIVARKMEWLTPFEASPSRSWKYIIMELNSTQLNFYAIPNTLENHLLSFKPIPQSNERTMNQFEESELKNLMSDFTLDDDLQFFKFCQRLNLIDNGSSFQSTKSNKKLLRSYSLQHSKIGLATDYKKRPNVLRLRIESEQILLNFLNTKDLIDWNMAINIGKDIALDLNDREIPKYRTVPRRRRRSTTVSAYNTNHLSNINNRFDDQSISQVLNKRLRSQSDPNNKLRDKLAKLKFKFGSNNNNASGSSSSKNVVTLGSSPLSASSSRMMTSQSANATNSAPVTTTSATTTPTTNKLATVRSNSAPTFSIYSESEYEDESAINSTFEEDDYEEDEEEEDIDTFALLSSATTNAAKKARVRANTIPTIMTTAPTGQSQSQTTTTRSNSNHIDYDEEDIQNLSDLHHYDDDDDEEEDEFQADDGEDIITPTLGESRPSTSSNSSYPSRPSLTLPRFDDNEDYKWSPKLDKTPSKRRYYKNCLRCIKPLTMEDSWVAKSLVKPSSLSPLNYAYLKHVKYNTPATIGNQDNAMMNTNLISSSPANPLSNNSSSSTNSSKSLSFNSRKPRSFSFKEMNGFSLPDNVLTKVPNHFLKEYLVGTHGLIPKEL
ncbi:hypothetical protein DFJ63DRAFT_291417 [Scheffersomyces coipomensis]|uniref:uncharacterized protein n=1 Tax=Scheffersomyces coipomensis TaxID=1788519 RepID=UPI00315D6558